jgi:hypothetical protein
MRSGVRVRRIDRRRCRAVAAAIALLAIGRVIGWNPAWRAFGVTPLQPPFFDMHVINDYAACAWKGVDAFGRPFGLPLWRAAGGSVRGVLCSFDDGKSTLGDWSWSRCG